MSRPRKPIIAVALRSSPWGVAAIAAGAHTIDQAAILHFLGMRKRETATEYLYSNDAGIARDVGVSTTAALAAITDLMDRHVIRPVAGFLGEEGVTVCPTHRAAVDRLATMDMPADAPRRRASFSVAEVLAEACP